MEENLKAPAASELEEMLRKAREAYGDRPVKIEINGNIYMVNDLRFSHNGKDFLLFFH